MRVFPAQSLRRLRDLCDKHGLLLILDEVQSGVGRTGKFFAHEWAGITPDIMAVAKGIGGGFPMGAVLASRAPARYEQPGVHGTRSAATRSPWPSATPCSTSCWRMASSTR